MESNKDVTMGEAMVCKFGSFHKLMVNFSYQFADFWCY